MYVISCLNSTIPTFASIVSSMNLYKFHKKFIKVAKACDNYNLLISSDTEFNV